MPDARATLETALSGTYVFERELGRGGMATVYLARDLKHQRMVALKVLRPELAHELGTERFHREIQVAARLQHPHILSVHDSGDAAGHLWFTMPFVEGESLRDRLGRERQLPLDDALRIAQDVARALDYAHQHGVVHRDIKPENILLTEDGSTLVADFGIARALDSSERLTQTGLAIGTPAYMSPEQATGDRAVDARSDTYSLAAVLYEMLAGEAPFTGPTAQAVIARRFTEPPPSVRRLRPKVPASIDVAIQQGMAALPADRFATTGEFVRAVVSSHSTAPLPTHVVPARSRKRAIAVAAAVLVIAVVGYLGWARMRAAPSGGIPAKGVRIVVLPFENRGDSADAYFADGVSEAVRAKLTYLPGIAVIARASSESYARTTTPLEAIAEELDVDYLLSGTVRWAHAPDGSSRVQVNPELVEIVKGKPQSRWQQPFDAPVHDVFRVQGDIASQVAAALNVHLSPPLVEQLGKRPTQNLAAYDAMLKGDAVRGFDLGAVQHAEGFFREAATLDSSFAPAWARWARSLAVLSASSGTGSADKRAAAVAVLNHALTLDSTSAEAYRARMQVAYSVTNDERELNAAVQAALARYPNDPSITRAAGVTAGINGYLDSAVVLLRRAVTIDPKAGLARRQFGNFLVLTGRPAEAWPHLELALALVPGDFTTLRHLAEAGLVEEGPERAHRAVADELGDSAGTRLAGYLVEEGLAAVLTPPEREAILQLPVSAFNGDTGARAMAFAQIYHLKGDTAKSRSWARTAHPVYARNPGGINATGLAAVALAYAGNYETAILQGRQALADHPAERVREGHMNLARIYMLAGAPAKAMVEIEAAHAVYPSALLAAVVRSDPVFAPLRNDPRLAALEARRPT